MACAHRTGTGYRDWGETHINQSVQLTFSPKLSGHLNVAALSNIRYEVDSRRQGIGCGGIGNIHQLALRSGLVAEIDRRLSLLKRHIPYHESDHVLT